MKSRASCPSVLFIRHILHPRVAGNEPESAARAWSWQSTRVKSRFSSQIICLKTCSASPLCNPEQVPSPLGSLAASSRK